MFFQNGAINSREIVVAAMTTVVLALAGCDSGERFRPAYLSGNERLVGGGLKIVWEAPEPGTAYLVEKTTGRLVQTVTLAEGEPYTFAVESIVEAEDLEELLGIEVAKAQFLLYFEPAGRPRLAPLEED